MDKRLIVVGDGFIDRYWLGSSTRLSPEAPIPVVKIESTFDLPGGAANVRENIRSLGEEGLMLFKSLSSKQNYPIKNRLICQGEQIGRWDQNDWCEPFGRVDLLPLLDSDAVVVSDYGKGSLGKEVIQNLHDYRGPLFVDTKSNPSDWLGSQAVMFPNLKEWKEFEEIYSWFPQVLLKQGEMGMSWVEYGKVVMTRPSLARYVRSVNGAGDTVIAAFAVASVDGNDLGFCMDFASTAAAISVEHDYTYAPSCQEVIERLSSHQIQFEEELMN